MTNQENYRRFSDKHAHFNPLLSLKALGYFVDGDLAALSNEIKAFLMAQVLKADLHFLPNLQAKLGLFL